MNRNLGIASLLMLALAGCTATAPTAPPNVAPTESKVEPKVAQVPTAIGIGNLLGATHLEKPQGVLKGAGIGEGIGYLINNKNDQDLAARESEKAKANGYQHNQTGSLAGTKWDLAAASAKPADLAFKKMEVDFESNGKVITRTELEDGKKLEATEIYRVYSGILIVNRPGYLINVSFIMGGDYMTVVTPTTTVVLKKRGT